MLSDLGDTPESSMSKKTVSKTSKDRSYQVKVISQQYLSF